ncbi:MAG: hypothetical protein M1830_001594 [Pleopsidium flavum]|nr:MAG: hypothetical protein M1830_001594 [Pleopsidium flavum]
MPALSYTKQAPPQHVSNQGWSASTPIDCLDTPGCTTSATSVLPELLGNVPTSLHDSGISRLSTLYSRNQYSRERRYSSTSNAGYSTVESAGMSGNIRVTATDPDLIWLCLAAGILILFLIGWCILKAGEISRRHRSDHDPTTAENGQQSSATVGNGSSAETTASSFLSRKQSQESPPEYQREDPIKTQTSQEDYGLGRL